MQNIDELLNQIITTLESLETHDDDELIKKRNWIERIQAMIWLYQIIHHNQSSKKTLFLPPQAQQTINDYLLNLSRTMVEIKINEIIPINKIKQYHAYRERCAGLIIFFQLLMIGLCFVLAVVHMSYLLCALLALVPIPILYMLYTQCDHLANQAIEHRNHAKNFQAFLALEFNHTLSEADTFNPLLIDTTYPEQITASACVFFLSNDSELDQQHCHIRFYHQDQKYFERLVLLPESINIKNQEQLTPQIKQDIKAFIKDTPNKLIFSANLPRTPLNDTKKESQTRNQTKFFEQSISDFNSTLIKNNVLLSGVQ